MTFACFPVANRTVALVQRTQAGAKRGGKFSRVEERRGLGKSAEAGQTMAPVLNPACFHDYSGPWVCASSHDAVVYCIL